METEDASQMSSGQPAINSCQVEKAQCEQIAQMNQINSPLLRLPAELRICIHELVFTGSTVKIEYKLFKPPAQKRYTFYQPNMNVVSILRCCRQLYTEAISTDYRRCFFNFGLINIEELTTSHTWKQCRLIELRELDFMLWDLAHERPLEDVSLADTLPAVRHEQVIIWEDVNRCRNCAKFSDDRILKLSFGS